MYSVFFRPSLFPGGGEFPSVYCHYRSVASISRRGDFFRLGLCIRRRFSVFCVVLLQLRPVGMVPVFPRFWLWIRAVAPFSGPLSFSSLSGSLLFVVLFLLGVPDWVVLIDIRAPVLTRPFPSSDCVISFCLFHIPSWGRLLSPFACRSR